VSAAYVPACIVNGAHFILEIERAAGVVQMDLGTAVPFAILAGVGRSAVERTCGIALVRIRAVRAEVILAAQEPGVNKPTERRVGVGAAVGRCDYHLFADAVPMDRAAVLVPHSDHFVDDGRGWDGQTRATHGLDNLRDAVGDAIHTVHELRHRAVAGAVQWQQFGRALQSARARARVRPGARAGLRAAGRVHGDELGTEVGDRALGGVRHIGAEPRSHDGTGRHRGGRLRLHCMVASGKCGERHPQQAVHRHGRSDSLDEDHGGCQILSSRPKLPGIHQPFRL
jgi:hypothetical protein